MTSRHRFYNKDGEPISDFRKWAVLCEDAEYRRVALTAIGDSLVSTVWLGLDMGHAGPPLIFETACIGGPLGGEASRTATLADAQAVHEVLCARVRALTRQLTRAGKLPS